MLLRHIGEKTAGDAVEDALARLLADGTIPGVEAGASGTMEVAHRVADAVGARREEAARR
jgi:isocitrate/isopropylmalate dehydrogenase